MVFDMIIYPLWGMVSLIPSSSVSSMKRAEFSHNEMARYKRLDKDRLCGIFFCFNFLCLLPALHGTAVL